MLQKTWTILRDSYDLFSAQRASRLAAALAFYTMISLSPLLIVAVGTVDLIFDDEVARERLIVAAEERLPRSVAETVVPIIDGAGRSRAGGLATAFGVLALLLGASNVFNQLQDILNRLWDIEQEKKPFLQTVKERALAFAMVLGFGFLLIVVLIAQTLLATVSGLVPEALLPFNWLPLVDYFLSILSMTLLFGFIFRVLPDAIIRWRDAFAGGLVTALLFRLGLWGVGWYVARSSAGSAYGVAGSLLVTLLVIYYVSLIFLFGAALTKNIGRSALVVNAA